MPAGRPPVLTHADCAEICQLVAAGYSATAVARLIGRNVKTIWRHAARDQEFGHRLRAAQRIAHNNPLATIRRAAAASPRAAAWLAAHPIIPSPQTVPSREHSVSDAGMCRQKRDVSGTSQRHNAKRHRQEPEALARASAQLVMNESEKTATLTLIKPDHPGRDNQYCKRLQP